MYPVLKRGSDELFDKMVHPVKIWIWEDDYIASAGGNVHHAYFFEIWRNFRYIYEYKN